MKYNYRPTFKEYRASLRRRLKEFLLENSLHGIGYVVDIKRPKWERIMWFILIIVSIITTVVTIIIIWEKFQTEPTITGLDLETNGITIDPPQVFVCFDWRHLNHSHLQQVFLIFLYERQAYEQVYNWHWGSSIDLDTFDSISETRNNYLNEFEMMAPDCSNVVTDCKYKGDNQSCSVFFTKVIVAVGVCCKTNLVEPLNKTDLIKNFEFQTIRSYLPLRFYLQAKVDKSPRPGDRPLIITYFPVDIEYHVDVTYTTPELRYLTLRQRKCSYKEESISLNNCMIKYFVDTLLSHCNCVPWFLSFTKNKECPISKYSCLNRTTVDMDKLNCWLQCDHTTYTVDSVAKSNKNTNRITLRYWPMAFYKVEMRFGYLDLLVSFGGIASLFLGYSLLVSAEMGYYLLLRSYCGAVVHSSRQQYNIATIHVAEKVPNKIQSQLKYLEYVE
ncbi:pickpocket protein 28 [Lasioglossum baleicum]|uniref:pickpocket protein 28 n=1 Tax=Lasioglossum baleicum TaxID=434251 RepID=UPI003FCD86C3